MTEEEKSKSVAAPRHVARPRRFPDRQVFRLLGVDIFWRPKSERIGADLRRDSQVRLESTAELNIPSVARLIFDAVLDGVDRAIDANRQLESKANGVVVLCIAIIGFGANLWKDNAAVAHPLLTGTVLVVLVVAIFCALGVGWVKTYDLPSAVVYNLPTIVNEPANEAKILVELTESLSSYARDERNAGLIKAKWLFCATRLLLGGLALFVILAWFSIYFDRPTAAPKPKVAASSSLAGSVSHPRQHWNPPQGTTRPTHKRAPE